jgi:hypothetical protein
MASENIEGTATDTNGNTLQDAVIALFLTNKNASDGDINKVRYTRTDSNGDYVIKDHPDADGTSQEWHVASYYEDGTGEYNAPSKPSVEASVGPAIPNSLVTRPEDNNSGNAGESGLKITTSVEWVEIQAKISANVSGFSTAEIHTLDGSNNFDVQIASIDVSNKSAGDVLTFSDSDLSQNLDSSDDYVFTFPNASTVGYYGTPDFPYESSDGNISIVNGFNTAASGNTQGIALNFVEIGNINL